MHCKTSQKKKKEEEVASTSSKSPVGINSKLLRVDVNIGGL